LKAIEEDRKKKLIEEGLIQDIAVKNLIDDKDEDLLF
jgi:hypothetical protein